MTTSDLTVANTILKQLGGTRALVLMLGAHTFTGTACSLSFRFRARGRGLINGLRIALRPTDTYSIEFLRVGRGATLTKHVATLDDIYADALVDTIEARTGLSLRVPRILMARAA